ncbi:AfsR/SARP family transcriptional regulator [Streptomyces sp. ISL-98]|uniref:AfsR/SARP family transcriptional regulator n=1 Tax=Streptomyces sp. ISL-98 TaxID=2819192 RepID=UPI001BEBAB8B|nr:AfsR/SARP family transcriptional regulator [Streptomyces sp. ISL-98]MBT2510549.1 AfsR/SARP family transcriptional regulator [Streptomyces sp. ISL-98]
MNIGILGPLVVRSGGGDAAPTAPKPRQLLALLAARVDEVVSMDLLIDELWENRPPASAVTTVQTYVVQLRRALAGALQLSPAEVAGTVLPFTGWGYRLVAGSATHDAHAFLRCAESGREALNSGANNQASVMLRQALRMWRGPAFAGVRLGPHLLAHRINLEEYRLVTVEQRVEADLRLGHHHELIGELSGLVLQHPLHENLHALFMTSLYRAGRPAQALGVFRDLRKNLRAELGIEPSLRIRKLQQAVLAADPSLEAENRSKLFRLDLELPSGRAR